jgi:lycopene cyclase domain-containing protein
VTYLSFLFAFVVAPIALLFAALVRRERGVAGYGVGWLVLILVAAIVYTTPWDNYLVRNGVWWYGEDRVIGTIGYVPIEEYVFMALQPLLAGLWFLWWSNRWPEQPRERVAIKRATGSVVWLAIAAGGAIMLRAESFTYLGLILAWSAPVIAIQWAVGGEKIVSAGRAVWLGFVPPTLYLWCIDRFAIASGIWTISPRFTTNVHILGLPIEEAVFFLVTNLLVVKAMVLFLPSAAVMRTSPQHRRGASSTRVTELSVTKSFATEVSEK